MNTIANTFIIPADVPLSYEQDYLDNLNAITQESGNLMLFSCDHIIEHLHDDFSKLPETLQNPEHIFAIAQHGRVGAMAIHPGLFSRYGHQHTNINYIIKLNGKTNLIPVETADPYSKAFLDVPHIIELKEESDLPIRGIGYTIYIGNEYEASMLSYASKAVYQAHQHGLVAILWIYARGKTITNDTSAEIITGIAGLGNALGADFVIVKNPQNTQILHNASIAAGNTRLICVGGTAQNNNHLFSEIYNQLHIGNTAGCAIGRNIFQHSQKEAIAISHALSGLVCDAITVEQAIHIYTSQLNT